MVNSLTGAGSAGLIAGNLRNQSTQLAARMEQAASGNRLNRALEDIASLSVATGLSTQVSTLRTASQNVSQASSFLGVADGALGQQQAIFDRLTQLATQANSGALDDAARGALNSEFQALLQESDRLASQTNFNGVNLLDGSLAEEGARFQIGETAQDSVSLSIGGTTTASLFEGGAPDLLSQENAAGALSSLSVARDLLTSERAGAGAMAQALDFAGANIESAIQNQEAARANLADTDIAANATERSLLEVQRQASIATLSQTNQLSGNLLKLLAE
jgi:flagellin